MNKKQGKVFFSPKFCSAEKSTSSLVPSPFTSTFHLPFINLRISLLHFSNNNNNPLNSILSKMAAAAKAKAKQLQAAAKGKAKASSTTTTSTTNQVEKVQPVVRAKPSVTRESFVQILILIFFNYNYLILLSFLANPPD